MKIQESELTKKQKELLFDKPLKEFSDKDWDDLYKLLDKLREKQNETTTIQS